MNDVFHMSHYHHSVPQSPARRAALACALLLALAALGCSVETGSADAGGTSGSASGGDADGCAAGQVVTFSEPLAAESGMVIRYSYLAVDATNVYWLEEDDNEYSWTLVTKPKNGGAPSVVASGKNGMSVIAMDEANVYMQGSSGIIALPKSGDLSAMLAPTSGVVGAIAVNQDHVCWLEGLKVLKDPVDLKCVPKTGGAPTKLAGLAFADQYEPPPVLAIDSDRAYWVGRSTEKSPLSLLSMPISGGAPVALVPGVDALSVALDDARLHFTDNFTDNVGGHERLSSVPKSGGAPTRLVVGDNEAAAQRVAVTGSCVYWTDYGFIWTTSPDGQRDGQSLVRLRATSTRTDSTALVATSPRMDTGMGVDKDMGLGAIAADESGLYFVDGFTNRISKLAR
jgi:hypothetical protein